MKWGVSIILCKGICFLEKRLCLLIELIVHGRKTLLTFPLCFLYKVANNNVAELNLEYACLQLKMLCIIGKKITYVNESIKSRLCF
jgi:hypothetical protein